MIPSDTKCIFNILIFLICFNFTFLKRYADHIFPNASAPTKNETF